MKSLRYASRINRLDYYVAFISTVSPGVSQWA